MRGEIIDHTGDLIQVRLIDPLHVETVKKQAYNGKYYVIVEVFEKDSITFEQRKHLYALFGDIAEYIGLPLDAVESERKYQFMQDEHMDDFPSLANNQMKKTVASEFIEHTIDYCINNDIPFRKQKFYLTTDITKMLFALTMKRLCVVCGKPHSDIHHVNAIGMGANRTNHDHSKHEFLALCRQHHNESHQIGQREFMKKYYVKPVKLNHDHIKELGVSK